MRRQFKKLDFEDWTSGGLLNLDDAVNMKRMLKELKLVNLKRGQQSDGRQQMTMRDATAINPLPLVRKDWWFIWAASGAFATVDDSDGPKNTYQQMGIETTPPQVNAFWSQAVQREASGEVAVSR